MEKSRKETLSLQFGCNSNLIGSQFWDIQKLMLDDKYLSNVYNASVLHREVKSRYLHRALTFDLRYFNLGSNSLKF